ncbi:MAG: hypothetical protein NTV07_04755 [Candidatus Omnitrophica bacterium]|nr:hypothetical protein [Candidatus Omnitrophota bacterium]
MTQESFVEKQEENISIHIFSVSAAMVGVCVTLIGILNIISTLSRLNTICDELASIGAILFLIACIISYTAIKTKDRKRRYKLEKTADIIFLTALFLIVGVCVLIVRKLI